LRSSLYDFQLLPAKTVWLTMLTPKWIPASIQHWTRANMPNAQNLQHLSPQAINELTLHRKTS